MKTVVLTAAVLALLVSNMGQYSRVFAEDLAEDLADNSLSPANVLIRDVEDTCLALPKIDLAEDSPSAKSKYTIGLLAFRGVEKAIEEFGPTFEDYLNYEVGQKHFDPPISFELIPLPFGGSFFEDAANGRFDFIFSNPSALSCIESEVGATVLATMINQRRVGDETFDVEQYGGVVFTLADNDEINTLEDIVDKKVACVSMTGLGGAQAQFLEMQKLGMHHIQDLQQLIFGNNQVNVVNLVLNRTVDVGFVRTDQMERSVDPRTGKRLDPSTFKIINQQTNAIDINGNPFPFVLSTDIFPEFGFAAVESANTRVPAKVARLVQDALLSMVDHAAIAEPLADCYERNQCVQLALGGTDPETGLFAQQQCQDACYKNLTISDLQDCTSTSQAAALANRAIAAGRYAGWRTPLNYMQLRNMQQRVGFIRLNDANGLDGGDRSGNPRCLRSTELADAVVCPVGYRKKADNRIDTGCEDMGLSCEGFSCLCRPCSKIEVCENNTVLIRDQCVPLAVLLPSILIPCFLVIAIFVMFYVRHIQRQSDALWKIKPTELKFNDPPRVLGRGTFGLVLLAEYRGTKVAVKRVLPSRAQTPSKKRSKKQATSPFDYLDRSAPDDVSGSVDADVPVKTVSFEDVETGGTSDVDDKYRVHKQKYKRRRQIDPATGLPENLGFQSGYFPPSHKSSKSFSLRSNNWSRISAAKTKDIKLMQLDFIEEMRQISRLRHPCITTVMGAVIDRKTEPMLVMEHMELGSLYDFLHNDSIAIEGKMAIDILRDVAQGLRFLHAADPSIVHGDLKSLNVLVDGRFRAKVADFGFTQKCLLRKTASGTPFWMAPELLRGEMSNSSASDVYSFGILLYEVFTRKDPYEDENHIEVLKLVADKNVQKRPPAPKDTPLEVQFLMKECLRDDPTMRPSAESIDQRLRQIEITSTEIKSKGMERSMDMLSRRFPYRIARSLKLGMKIEPQSHPAASVFYCEIINHSKLISSLSPKQASRTMDMFQSTIDNLCQVHNVFRMETVGDSFLAVTNVAYDQPDHVRIMANFALEVAETFSEMRFDNLSSVQRSEQTAEEQAEQSTYDTAADTDSSSRNTRSVKTMPRRVRIRIGLHTGPVVAHVVGTHNPRFAILGDTVKTAKTLEGCCKPNKIHASQDFAFELMQDTDDQLDETIVIKRVDDIDVRKTMSMVSYYLKQATVSDRRLNASTEKVSETMSTASRSSWQSDASSDDHRSASTVRSVLDKVQKNQAKRIQSAQLTQQPTSEHMVGEEVFLALSSGEGDSAMHATSSTTTLGAGSNDGSSRRSSAKMPRRLSKDSVASAGSNHSIRSDEVYLRQIMKEG